MHKISQQIWKKTKAIFLQPVKERALADLSVNDTGRLRIVTENFSFESCFLKRKGEELLVFLSGPARESYTEPAFWRRSWSVFFPESCLYIDDPSAMEKQFAPAFFWGAKKDLLALIQSVMTVHKFRRLTCIGSSNTGFVALFCAAHFPDSLCIALSPILDIPRYLKTSGLENTFPFDISSDITSVLPFLQKSPPHSFLSWNSHCDFDNEQIHLFFSLFQKQFQQGFSRTGNILTYISDRRVNEPHLFQPDAACVVYVHNLLRNSFTEQRWIFDAFDKSLHTAITRKETCDSLKKSKEYRLGKSLLVCVKKYSLFSVFLLPFLFLKNLIGK